MLRHKLVCIACLRPQPRGCRIAGISNSTMATIISMSANRTERSVTPARPQQQSAEIVIFPGIRYARIPNNEPVAQAAVNGERDRLVLPD